MSRQSNRGRRAEGHKPILLVRPLFALLLALLVIIVMPAAAASQASASSLRVLTYHSTAHGHDLHVPESVRSQHSRTGKASATAGQNRHANRDSRPAPGSVAAKTGAELPEGYSSFSAAKRAVGSPGEGNVFDHVVEQSQIRRSGFAPEEIHNPFNMNPVSARTNQIKANYYSSKQPFTGGGTVRENLTGQSFADQYAFGMDVLTQIRWGIIQ